MIPTKYSPYLLQTIDTNRPIFVTACPEYAINYCNSHRNTQIVTPNGEIIVKNS